MADSEQPADGARELHDTVSTSPPDGIPPEVYEQIPKHLRDKGVRLAEDGENATVDPTDTEQVPLVDEKTGEVYVVTMKDIAWPKKNRMFTESLQKTGQNSGRLDFALYYRNVAQEKIVSVEPEPGRPLAEWLQGLNERLGTQLESHLPDPVTNLEEDEEEN